MFVLNVLQIKAQSYIFILMEMLEFSLKNRLRLRLLEKAKIAVLCKYV